MTGLQHPRTVQTFRRIRLLLLVLLLVSLAALGFAVAEQGDARLVNSVVWIRGIAVVVGTVVLFAFARLAERGRRWAYGRLRLLSFLVPAGVVLLVAAPGAFPLWMKVEQGVCGAIILAVGVLLSQRHVRQAFARVPAEAARV